MKEEFWGVRKIANGHIVCIYGDEIYFDSEVKATEFVFKCLKRGQAKIGTPLKASDPIIPTYGVKPIKPIRA